LNSIVVHHLSENPHIVYGILAAHRQIEFLGQLTLNSALREVQDRQRSQRNALNTNKHKNPSKGKGRESTEEICSPRNEKSDSGHDGVRGSHTSFESLGEESELPFSMSPPSTRPGSVIGAHSELPNRVLGKNEPEFDVSLDEVMAQIAAGGRNNFAPTNDWVSELSLLYPLSDGHP
jgi:hypothetical protein